MNLGELVFIVPEELINLELIYMYKVSMPCSSLQQLITGVEALPQPVSIVLSECTITPEDEYLGLKDRIRCSDRYTVIYEDDFYFRTVKIPTE